MDARTISELGARHLRKILLFGSVLSGRRGRHEARRADANGCFQEMKLTIPELSLVVLIGATSSGKSTFARRHFKSTEILSSDFCRAILADDENDQSITNEAFELLHYIAAKRIKSGRLTVIDATNVQRESRQPLVRLARDFHVLPVAIVITPPEKILIERHQERDDRNFGVHVIRQQLQNLRRSVRG